MFCMPFVVCYLYNDIHTHTPRIHTYTTTRIHKYLYAECTACIWKRPMRARMRFPCAVDLRKKKNSCFDKKAATVPDCVTIKRI